MQRATVVLPQPLSPTSARVSPRRDRRSSRPARRARGRSRAAAARCGSGSDLLQAVDLEDGHALAPSAVAWKQLAPSPVGRDRRRHLGGAAAGDHLRAARMERAARRAALPDAAPRRRSSPAARAARRGGWAPSAAARAYRDGAGRRTAARTGANSTTRPRYMTATSSAIWAITPMSWVISISAMPLVRCRRRSSARICAWVVTSSAVVGSSAIRISGSAASASAMPTRWRRPPLSWNG